MPQWQIRQPLQCHEQLHSEQQKLWNDAKSWSELDVHTKDLIMLHALRSLLASNFLRSISVKWRKAGRGKVQKLGAQKSQGVCFACDIDLSHTSPQPTPFSGVQLNSLPSDLEHFTRRGNMAIAWDRPMLLVVAYTAIALSAILIIVNEFLTMVGLSIVILLMRKSRFVS